MKRLILLVVAALFASVGYAQTVKFTVPDVEVKVKRCICSGTTAYIDLVVTNWRSNELEATILESEPMGGYSNFYTAAHDDEGNAYRYKENLSITFSGVGWPFCKLPAEVPVKFRVYIKNLSKYASEFSLLKVAFRGISQTEPYGAALLEIRNIPITRQ
jgi:hypothetical protein